MKNTIKFLAAMRNIVIIAFVVVIGFSLFSCGDPEQGPIGPQGPQGPAGSLKVVDSTGKEIGKYIHHYADQTTQAIVATGDFTFAISLTSGTILTTTLYASGTGGSGSIYVSSLSAFYPNYIRKNKGEYFIPKNRDINGYPTSISTTFTPASQRTNTGDWEAFTTTQSNVVEVEKVSAATNDSYFTGTITPPLRIVW